MLAMFGTFALREKISAIYFYFRVLSREVTFAALHFVLRTLPVRLPLLSWIKVDNGGETRSKKQRRVTSVEWGIENLAFYSGLSISNSTTENSSAIV